MAMTRSSRLVAMLIGANVLIFAVVNIAMAIGWETAPLWLALPAWPMGVVERPWTLLSYMFTQWNFIHLAVNMLWLWMWTRVNEVGGTATLSGEQNLVAYFAGGLTGGVTYLIAAAAGLNCGLCLAGSSAAVVGVIAAGAVGAGKTEINLLIFGRVRLVWAAAIAIALCLLGDLSGDPGTALAHGGGLLGGLAYGLWLKTRRDHRARSVGQSGNDRADLDAILGKVSRSGYGSLNADERRRLFEISKRQ